MAHLSGLWLSALLRSGRWSQLWCHYCWDGADKSAMTSALVRSGRSQLWSQYCWDQAEVNYDINCGAMIAKPNLRAPCYRLLYPTQFVVPESSDLPNSLHITSYDGSVNLIRFQASPKSHWPLPWKACEIPMTCGWDKNKITVFLLSASVDLLIAVRLGCSGLFFTKQRGREMTEGSKAIFLPRCATDERYQKIYPWMEIHAAFACSKTQFSKAVSSFRCNAQI